MMFQRMFGCLLSLLVLLGGSAAGQVDDIQKHPGYVNLKWIQVPPDAERVTDVFLGPRLIGLAKRLSEDRRMEETVRNLDETRVQWEEHRRKLEEERRGLEMKLVSLQVKAFDLDSIQALKMRQKMNRFEQTLQLQNWTPIIRVKNNRQFTNVSVKYGGNRKVEGFFIMSMDPRCEASFVNLIGDVDPARIRSLVVDLNQDAVDSLRKALKRNASGNEKP